MTEQPDFRALCAELIDKIGYTWGDIPPDVEDLVTRAQVALNTPPLAQISVSKRLPEAEDCAPNEGRCAEVLLKNVSLEQIDLLKLIGRSADIGDGWRQSSEKVREHVVLKHTHGDLMELDHENKRARLTSKGEILLEYIK
jgi:uncharacterized protein (DUF736 family)